MFVFIAHEHVRDFSLPSNFILLPILVYIKPIFCVFYYPLLWVHVSLLLWLEDRPPSDIPWSTCLRYNITA